MHHIQVSANSWGKTLPLNLKKFFFRSGEQHIQILNPEIFEELGSGYIDIDLQWLNDGDFVTLLMIQDAIHNICSSKNWGFRLNLPYFPGARQDRVCNTGEAFSLRVYANFINSLGFDEVRILDPHSDVTPALIKNVIKYSNHGFIGDVIKNITANGDQNIVLVSPDAGSNKKIYDLTKFLGGLPVIRCDKLRDVTDGKIIDSVVYADDLTGKTALIVDDIISGGATFKGLAQKLKEKHAAKVFLAVTHNEGVANLKDLQAHGINRMFTTNSLPWNTDDYNKSNFIVEFPYRKYIAP